MVKARRLAPGTAVTLAAAASYFCVQLAHTLRDSNRWPFCAYNMFNYHVPDRCEQLRVVFYDSDGRTTGPTDPWGMLPVEFFRVVSVLEKVYLLDAPDRVRKDFSRAALAWMNHRPWPKFDEVRSSATGPSALPLRAFDVFLVEIGPDECDPRDRSDVLSARLIHRHDPIGVAPAAGEAFAGTVDREHGDH